MLDLSAKNNLILNDMKEPAQYGGWWYLGMPSSAADELPFPMFIKRDDEIFGIRRMKDHVVMNGIGVWHDSFESKINPIIDYYFSIRYSNYLLTDLQNNQSPFLSETPDADELKTNILGENVIGCTSMPMLTRQESIDVGGFNESFKSNQEWDLWMRMLQKYEAKYSPNIAGIRHYSDDRITNRRFKWLAGWISLFIHHAPKYHNNKEQLKTALGFFIGEMFEKKMFLSGITALPLYVMLKRKYEKR